MKHRNRLSTVAHRCYGLTLIGWWLCWFLRWFYLQLVYSKVAQLIIARVQAPSRINTTINNASESAHPAQDGAITKARRTPCADAPALRAAGKNEAHKNETHEKNFGAPPTQTWHQDHMGGGGTQHCNHWGHPSLAHGALCGRSVRGPPHIAAILIE